MTKQPKDPKPRDYAVGRGKPPHHTRFPPGKSANPGGRKKGSLNLKTILEVVLNSHIVLTEHGRSRKAPILEALILSAIKNGMSGNQRAIEYLLDKCEAMQARGQEREMELEQDDQDLLDAVLMARGHIATRVRGGQGRPGGDAPDRENDVSDDDDNGPERPALRRHSDQGDLS